MPSNHLILCRPLLLLPCIFPSIRVFSSELALHIRWPKWWSFSFSISPSNEYSELISFRINLFDLLAVQGILRSLLQYHSSKASILWHSTFFMVQLSYPYMTTGKTIVLTIQPFVGKVISLFFDILSRLVIAFLPRSNRLLISWLQSPSAVILEPKKIKSVAVSIVSSSICHEVMGPEAMILVFLILRTVTCGKNPSRRALMNYYTCTLYIVLTVNTFRTREMDHLFATAITSQQNIFSLCTIWLNVREEWKPEQLNSWTFDLYKFEWV